MKQKSNRASLQILLQLSPKLWKKKQHFWELKEIYFFVSASHHDQHLYSYTRVFKKNLLATQVSALKSYATQNIKNVNCPKFSNRVELVDLHKVWEYFGYFDPRSAKWFCCGLFRPTWQVCGFPPFFIFILGHKKARDPSLKTSRPKFGSRPIVWKPLAYVVWYLQWKFLFKFELDIFICKIYYSVSNR